MNLQLSFVYISCTCLAHCLLCEHCCDLVVVTQIFNVTPSITISIQIVMIITMLFLWLPPSICNIVHLFWGEGEDICSNDQYHRSLSTNFNIKAIESSSHVFFGCSLSQTCGRLIRQNLAWTLHSSVFGFVS